MGVVAGGSVDIERTGKTISGGTISGGRGLGAGMYGGGLGEGYDKTWYTPNIAYMTDYLLSVSKGRHKCYCPKEEEDE